MGLVIENVRVHALDPAGRVGSAIAIRGGRIVAIGDRDIARDLPGPWQRVDGSGATVLPGLIDAHTHFHKAALGRAFGIDYLELAPRSIADVVEQVRMAASSRPRGAWVRGESLDPRRLIEGRYPNRWELDAVAPEHPVVLFGVGNHVAVANSLALARAAIDRTTPDPPGGSIERTDDGEPTGVLFELGKLNLDPNLPTSVLPAPSGDERLEAIERAQARHHAAGVTTIHDITMDPAEIRGWMRLREQGRLTLRVRFLVRGYEARTSVDDVISLGLRAGFGDEWLQFSGVKYSVDGAAGERNAAMHEPYPGTRHRGLIRIDQDRLRDLVDRAHAAGIRVAIHAIGDRAVDIALAAFEDAFDRHGRGDLRHRIEHAFMPPPPTQIRRIAAAGLIVSTQPGFLWDGDGWAATWGADQLQEALPIRAWLDSGIVVCGSTDHPCIPPSPWPGIVAAVARTSRDDDVIGPDQAITLREAVRLHTTSAAWAGYDERLLGSLEPGRAADLALYAGDPFELPLDAVRSLVAQTTIVGGRIVHDPGGLFPEASDATSG